MVHHKFPKYADPNFTVCYHAHIFSSMVSFPPSVADKGLINSVCYALNCCFLHLWTAKERWLWGHRLHFFSSKGSPKQRQERLG